MRRQLLSFEGLVGLFVGLFAAVAEVSWELRSLGVLLGSIVAIHIARRLDVTFLKKVGIAVGAIVLLLLSTWRPIWKSLHEDFPDVAGETVLSRIIVVSALSAAALAVYVFLIRPRREGYRLIPAQLIAFGGSLIAVGFIAAAIGLIWQFQQNREMGLSSKVGPNLLPGPNLPQIPSSPTPEALPPPPSAPDPQSSTSAKTVDALMDGYNLTSAGSRILVDEAFKIKDVLPTLVVRRLNNDNSSGGLADAIVRALSRGGIQASIGFGQLGGPKETGAIILFDDPENLPPPAAALKAALEKAGMNVSVIKRKVGEFQFFIGPDPKS